MKKLVLLKTNKDNIEKTIIGSYIFDDVNSDINNIKLINNNNDINMLVNYYTGINNTLVSIFQDHNIININNDIDFATDYIKYNDENNTLDLITYMSAITFTDMKFIDNDKYMIGHYNQNTTIIVDGSPLDIEPDFSSVLTKTRNTLKWKKQIKHVSGGDSTKGPIITELEKDESGNFYIFGNLTTNINSITVLNIENTLINPNIQKINNTLILTKTSETEVLWRILIEGSSSTSLLLNPQIRQDNNKLYFSFNFSGSITIGNNYFSTNSEQIINTIYGSMSNNGEILWLKQIKTEQYVSCFDFCIDDKYIYSVGKYKGNVFFDDFKLNSLNFDAGYVIKIKKSSGTILNTINIYSDDKLNVNSISQDFSNIFVSGTWKGNIYFNGKIKSTTYSDFFITNIKKNKI